jgi:hypothetical protein
VAISASLINSYAQQFLPQFQFADTELVFPISVDSWLVQCADGDWQESTDPHAGTTVVEATAPVDVSGLVADGGCQGVAGAPLDPNQPLPAGNVDTQELFIDFAGWESLSSNDGLIRGNHGYILDYFSAWFGKLNPESGTRQEPLTRTPPTMPDSVTVYCEAAWAGDFTRASQHNHAFDFAPAVNGGLDARLDAYFVLSYYLFYPLTLSPPPNNVLAVSSPDLLLREGQWEAVSLYFNAAPDNGKVGSTADLRLPPDPAMATPAHAVLSYGIQSSGDGRSPASGNNYPAKTGSWSAGGQIILSGAFGSEELVPQRVYVTSGTHRNLFSPTPTTTTSTPDQGWTATGGALEGAGGAVAGAGGPLGWIFGGLLIFIGFLMQLFGKDSATTEQPDGDGDIASSSGPAAGAVPGASAGASTFTATDLHVLSTLPETQAQLQAPAWWPFPGRWGIAVSSGTSSWDNGGRRTDFLQRSRAYWNTVWLQHFGLS